MDNFFNERFNKMEYIMYLLRSRNIKIVIFKMCFKIIMNVMMNRK